MKAGAGWLVQALLGLYFFFFGWAVGQRQGLLVMPVATAVCSLVLWGAAAASARFLPRYRCAPPPRPPDRTAPVPRHPSPPGWELCDPVSASGGLLVSAEGAGPLRDEPSALMQCSAWAVHKIIGAFSSFAAPH